MDVGKNFRPAQMLWGVKSNVIPDSIQEFYKRSGYFSKKVIYSETPQEVMPTIVESRVAIKQLKKKEAQGIDMILTKLLEHGIEDFEKQLH